MEWISVKDRLPEWKNIRDCKSYYVYLNNSFGCKYDVWVYVGNGKWWWEQQDETFTDAVTHWMPLPKPPESEEE